MCVANARITPPNTKPTVETGFFALAAREAMTPLSFSQIGGLSQLSYYPSVSSNYNSIVSYTITSILEVFASPKSPLDPTNIIITGSTSRDSVIFEISFAHIRSTVQTIKAPMDQATNFPKVR
jgi:hypothetical protein